MNILMVSSEATPFAKSGGLADAVSALSRAMRRAGHDVRIVMPRYYSIDKAGLDLIPQPMGVKVGPVEEWCAVYQALLPSSDIPVYFVDHEKFFGRDGIYGDKIQSDFADNAQRFAFFSASVFQVCRKICWIPEVFHAHDWPSALVPVYLRYNEREGEFSSSVSVFTIHNLGYQGVYPKHVFPFFNLPWDAFHGAGLEYFDNINLLKAGIACAHKLTTVSPTYASEIQTPEYGCSLDGLLRARRSDLVGILNGVDLDDWNPSTDTLIPATFSHGKMAGKAVCKKALQKEFGLPEDPSVPVIGLVTRLTDQKGVGDLFGPTYGAAWPICRDMKVQFIIQGSGEAWCENELRSLSEKLPNLKARIGYSEKTAHLIEAGSDYFIMPSRYEPCGLNQMYSLHYGTIPIVRRTGGLADTVSNYNQDTGDGTGFVFDYLSPRAIYDTVGWAVWVWYNRQEHLLAMRARAMQLEFSWDKSAREHGLLYKKIATAAKTPRETGKAPRVELKEIQ